MERPASICTEAVTSTVDSLMCDSFKRNHSAPKRREHFSPPLPQKQDMMNYFCTEESCILEQLRPCKQKQCKILSII